MHPVARHSGRRARRTSPRLVLGYLLGTVVTIGAWLYLISAAITFGVLARSGTDTAWIFTALAGLGATACLLIALILLTRLLRELGVLSPAPGTRGGRRAAR
jgi:predicted acyltransferase